ncbi:type II toxin-antitoxin system VapB family antitoxin [Flexivirga sp.]|uniref:type II toxin-antitoxin system VapB family antitoxin n=1 Tax=Flexivirga sp. TaxID=1962927 RepID=UPI003F7F0D7E
MATLNIKDPEVHRMAHELATRRHTTATGAVRDALAKALAEDDSATVPNGEEILEEIREIARRSAARPEPFLSDDDLYDENGLPK